MGTQTGNQVWLGTLSIKSRFNHYGGPVNKEALSLLENYLRELGGELP
jgi:hypothetical protein